MFQAIFEIRRVYWKRCKAFFELCSNTFQFHCIIYRSRSDRLRLTTGQSTNPSWHDHRFNAVHHRFHLHLLVWHGLLGLVGDFGVHLVSGRRSQMVERGDRRLRQLLSRRGMGGAHGDVGGGDDFGWSGWWSCRRNLLRWQHQYDTVALGGCRAAGRLFGWVFH